MSAIYCLLIHLIYVKYGMKSINIKRTPRKNKLNKTAVNEH